MHVGSNPTARTSQSQSPRSPYRGAGRLFCTRFAGSMTSRRHQIMICGSLLPIPPRLSNRYIPHPYQSPRLPYRFSRASASENPIRFAVPRPYSAWRDATLPSFSPRSLHDWRGEFVSRLALVRLSFCSRYAPRFPIRPIGFSPSSSSRFPPDSSGFPLLSAFLYGRRGGCVFLACISVFPSIPP